MRFRALWSYVACIPLLSSVAAQDSQQPPPGGGGGGATGQQEGRQDRPRGRAPALTPEEREAAWKMQVDALAAELDLADDVRDRITEQYIEVRKAHGAKLDELRAQMRGRFGEGRGGGVQGGGEGAEGGTGGGTGAPSGGGEAFAEMQARMHDITTTSRDDLSARLAAILQNENLEAAKIALGALDQRWDGMVHAVSGFGLDDEARYVVLWVVQSYIVDSAAAMEAAGGDRQAMMDASRQRREKLEADLKDILSEDQIRQLTRAAGGGRGRGGRSSGGGSG